MAERLIINRLRGLNPYIEIYDVRDGAFKKYGRVLDLDTCEFVAECAKIPLPGSGTEYDMSLERLERLGSAEEIRMLTVGGCDAQIGICMGHNSYMNGLEFHKSSEINIAATPLVLLLGLEYEMEENEFSADKVKAFYLEKGDIVEVYATSLHFCPCQVSDDGFKCVVALPEGTNAPIENCVNDKLLFRKNKWLICHDGNKALIEKGVYPGIHGKNYQIKY